MRVGAPAPRAPCCIAAFSSGVLSRSVRVCVRALLGLRLRGVNVYGCVGVWVCVLRCVVCVLEVTTLLRTLASVDASTNTPSTARTRLTRVTASLRRHTSCRLKSWRTSSRCCILRSTLQPSQRLSLSTNAFFAHSNSTFPSLWWVHCMPSQHTPLLPHPPSTSLSPIALVGELHAIAAHPTHRPHPSLPSLWWVNCMPSQHTPPTVHIPLSDVSPRWNLLL
jgi:hypothetical protein